jgi:hypothetical protein
MRVEIDGQNFDYLEHVSINDEDGESIQKEYVKGNVTVSGNEIIGTITETNRDDSPGAPLKCCLYENDNILSDCAFGEENVSDLDCSVPIHKTN